MRQAAQADRADDLDAAHSIFRMMISSSAWLADHECVAADRLEPVAIVEAPGAVIVGVDGEVELLEPLAPRFVQRPVAQRLGDAAAVMVLEDVDLSEFDRAGRRLDRKCDGPSLTIADELAVRLGNAEAIARVGKLLGPRLGRELARNAARSSGR